jgi:poly(A) polymerase
MWKHIIPEVDVLFGCEQGDKWHSEGDVFKHTALVLENMEGLGETSPLVFMAGLLHDIGKPYCQRDNGDGNFSFYCHDVFGDTIAERILRRLSFSNKEIKLICFLVRNHMRMHSFAEMKLSKRRRLMSSPYFEELWMLCRADAMSAYPIDEVDRENSRKQLWDINVMVNKMREFDALEKPIVTGQDLINNGYSPNSKFKQMLNFGFDLQLEGMKDKEVILDNILMKWEV